ncbi:hypothetical protein [Halorarum salinum]|uniref:MCM C-terminal domain-containing protein n=1 Tax=Halorarum salinum TaxID=2743089 RepID=A0A7D5QIP8_9EURY|nr:hypothetical protein [Halobaculum salinum]QLG63184.1 hypothetical protein HUG12_16175 [Halobaculum salinum]
MSVEVAFDHLDSSNDLEQEAEEHRERAAEKLRELVEDGIDFDAEVTIEHGETDSFSVTVVPDALKDFTDSILEEGEYGASVSGARLLVSRGESDLLLSQRDRIKGLKDIIAALSDHYSNEPGAPIDVIIQQSSRVGMDPDKAEQEIESLRRKGEVYEPQNGYLRTT